MSTLAALVIAGVLVYYFREYAGAIAFGLAVLPVVLVIATIEVFKAVLRK